MSRANAETYLCQEALCQTVAAATTDHSSGQPHPYVVTQGGSSSGEKSQGSSSRGGPLRQAAAVAAHGWSDGQQQGRAVPPGGSGIDELLHLAAPPMIEPSQAVPPGGRSSDESPTPMNLHKRARAATGLGQWTTASTRNPPCQKAIDRSTPQHPP